MRGINIAEQCHVVNLVPPRDIDTVPTSDVLSMQNWSHASIIVTLGVTGAAATITVEACDNFTPSNTTAIPFALYREETAAGDTLAAREEIAAAGFATSTNDSLVYIIEVDATALPDGKPCLRVVTTDPAAATFGSIIAILSGGRYVEDVGATAIA